MNDKVILLVEDNPSDIGLTRRALEKKHIANEMVVAEDGQEALDYLFGTGRHAGRDARQLPAVVLLDLKLPRVDGLTVLKSIRSNPRTALTPVVVLTTSKEEQDLTRAIGSVAAATSASRLISINSPKPSLSWASIGWCSMKRRR